MRRLAYTLITVALALVLVELAAALTVAVSDDLFDHRAGVIERIRAHSYPAEHIDPVLGWVPRPGISHEADCRGEDVTYTVAEDGARSYPGYRPGGAEILVAGDSYTYGSEVVDALAYPAVLARLIDTPVANLGVGGYDPVQALLRLEQRIDDHPAARAIVLGIMYENVHRMLNSYRPVLYEKADVLAFKPYMADGVVQPHPGTAVGRSAEALEARAQIAFDEDFWRKPAAGFPFTRALIRSLGSDYFRLRKVQKRLRNAGLPEYAMTFETPAVQENLLGLLARLAAVGEARGLETFVVFMPRNRHDVESVSEFLARRRESLPPSLHVSDVGAGGLDWSRYNLENPADDNICHPSTYGYEGIARHVAAALADAGWPEPVGGSLVP